eukprot:COSAG01_NODE_7058_length_3373_cov_1.332010_2_plen_93_part_00
MRRSAGPPVCCQGTRRYVLHMRKAPVPSAARPVRRNGAGDGICGKCIVRWHSGDAAPGGLDQTSGISGFSAAEQADGSIRRLPADWEGTVRL